MRFESFIQALDLGQCEDQMQRESLFDIAMLFIMIDGVITDSENEFLHTWLDDMPWTSDVSKNDYFTDLLDKCAQAINGNTIEEFIAHRARQMVDKSVKDQAIRLAVEISNVDGELHPKEQEAIEFLQKQLEDKLS